MIIIPYSIVATILTTAIISFSKWTYTSRLKLDNFYIKHLQLYHPKLRYRNPDNWYELYQTNKLTSDMVFGCTCPQLEHQKKMYAFIRKWSRLGFNQRNQAYLVVGAIFWPIALPIMFIAKSTKVGFLKLDSILEKRILRLSEENPPGPHMLEAIEEVDKLLAPPKSSNEDSMHQLSKEIFEEEQEKKRLQAIKEINEPFRGDSTDSKNYIVHMANDVPFPIKRKPKKKC